MLIEEFIEYLNNQKNKDIILELKGIIETTIKIKHIEIEEMDKYLTIKSEENKEQKIKINLHQLMKIDKINEDEFLLEFDQLQTIKIKLFSI